MSHEHLSYPVVENGVLAGVSGLDMRSWYEPRPDTLMVPVSEGEKTTLNLDLLQQTLNQRMRDFCRAHGLSHQVVQTANLYNWFLRSLRRRGENGPPESLPPTPTLSAGNPEETAAYASFWGLAEPSDEQKRNMQQFTQAMGIDLESRKLPERVLTVRQRCLRVKDFDTLDTFHNPVFNMDGNNYLGTRLTPADWVNYMLDTVESLGFPPSDLHVTYHPGGAVKIKRDNIEQEVYVPEMTPATEALRNWFSGKSLPCGEHLHAYYPSGDPEKGMGAVWGPGGNTYWDKTGKQFFGPFGPHFEVFVKIGGVYHELANGIFKKYLATNRGLYTLGADQEGCAKAVTGIKLEEDAATVSMEAVIGYERALALLDYCQRKKGNIPHPHKVLSIKPWERQKYHLVTDGPNVFAVPGTSTYTLMKFLSDRGLIHARGIDPGSAMALTDMQQQQYIRQIVSKWTAIIALFHSGYPLNNDVLERHIKECRVELRSIGVILNWWEGNLDYSWLEFLKDMEKTVVSSDPEFFRRRREGFVQVLLGIEERKQLHKILSIIRGREFATTLNDFIKNLENNQSPILGGYYTFRQPSAELADLLTRSGIDSGDLDDIWQVISSPLEDIYSAARSASYYEFQKTVNTALSEMTAGLANPDNASDNITRLRELFPEIDETIRLTQKGFFPPDLSFLTKLTLVRISALDRYYQLELLRATAFEYEGTEVVRRQAIEAEIAREYSISPAQAQKVLEVVSALILPPDLRQNILFSTHLSAGYSKGQSTTEKLAINLKAALSQDLTKRNEGELIIALLQKKARESTRRMIGYLTE